MEEIKITEEQRERIRKIQLEMLREVHRICEENHIKYVLGYGTMLGAVRHKGFIPWDDDVDILMLRKDYRRFREACKKELPPKRSDLCRRQQFQLMSVADRSIFHIKMEYLSISFLWIMCRGFYHSVFCRMHMVLY